MSSTNRGIVFQQLDRLFRDGTLAGLGDRQLLERYLSRRDEAAFEALVDLHGPMVLGLCRRFLRDPRDVEDAFQATFLVLVRKAAGIRDRGLLSNWLYGVALRVATRARANLLRRRGRETAIGDFEFTASVDGKDMLGIGPVLDQELSRLPAKYRAPLVLCYLRGQTHDQAAAELRCPVGTVRSRMARGRDLLKRRLTRQGYAPTAALFGPGLDLPVHLLTEVVPAPLVAATVEGAFAFGSSQTVHASAAAASVLALTQGALTSMKLAQMKWIGLALLTTGLSAGGAIGFAAVSAQKSIATERAGLAPGGTADPFQETTTGSVTTSSRASRSSKTTEERLDALEQQIDRILRLSGSESPAFAHDTSTLDRLETKLQSLLSRHDEPSTSRSSSPAGKTQTTSTGTLAESTGRVATSKSSRTTRSDVGPASGGDGPGTKIRELEAQLNQAMVARRQAEKLHKRAVISQEEVLLVGAKVDLTIATLEGLNDDYTEEIDQLRLEIRRKKAELDRAIAQKNAGLALVARNTRLNERKPGMVAAEDVAKAEAELGSAEAHIRVKEVELEESQLHLRQLQRRRERIGKILELTRSPEGAEAPAPAGGR